jgi:hypothetical protein
MRHALTRSSPASNISVVTCVTHPSFFLLDSNIAICYTGDVEFRVPGVHAT